MEVPTQVLEEMDRVMAFIAEIKQSAANHGFEVASAITKPDVVYSHYELNIVICAKSQ